MNVPSQHQTNCHIALDSDVRSGSMQIYSLQLADFLSMSTYGITFCRGKRKALPIDLLYFLNTNYRISKHSEPTGNRQILSHVFIQSWQLLKVQEKKKTQTVSRTNIH